MSRVVTTLALAALVLAAIWYLPTTAVKLLLLAAVGLGLWEYGKLLLDGWSGRSLLLILGGGMAVLSSWSPHWRTTGLGLLALLFVALLWGLARRGPVAQNLDQSARLILGVCYLSLTIPIWGWIHAMGREWVMLLLFPSCLTDTFGFLAGKCLGKHKLAPEISPNKTWEGFFGSLLGGGVFGLWLAAKIFFPDWEIVWPKLLIAGLSISLLAVFGDLIESFLKRSAGAKDSSHLIPGHGGALDRLDALVFTAPWFYFLLSLNNFGP